MAKWRETETEGKGKKEDDRVIEKERKSKTNTESDRQTAIQAQGDTEYRHSNRPASEINRREERQVYIFQRKLAKRVKA